MPKPKTLLSLLVFLLVLMPTVLRAQQDEIPPVSEQASVADASQGDRIVDHRPRLYSIKRVAHPVSWLEGGISPVLRLAEKFGSKAANKSEEKTPRDSGIQYGFIGFGGSTGFGPMVKPFDKNLFNTGLSVELPVGVTYKMYESAAVRLDYPLISDRIGIDAVGEYLSRPADFFFGIGNDAPHSNESRFRTVSRRAAAGLHMHFNESWSARVESGFRSVGVTDPREPTPMADVFRGQNIPGMMTGATMLVSTASLQRNTTDNPYLPATGGRQQVEASLVEGQRGGDVSYWRYRLELQQFLPLSEDHRQVLGLRGDLETNQAKGGSSVPFFDLPGIGSYTTVRGYWTNRFVDRSAMSATVEYRYRIWRYFDWGLFVDGGQVAPEIGNFAMDRFHMGYGMRFITRSLDRRHVISVDLARSREAWLFYLNFGGLF